MAVGDGTQYSVFGCKLICKSEINFYICKKQTIENMKHLNFPSAKSIVVSGDIHGDFNQLIFKMCVQYQMRDTLLIVAGDCGIGLRKFQLLQRFR